MSGSTGQRGSAPGRFLGHTLRSFQTKMLVLVLCGVLIPPAVLWLFAVRDTEQFQTSQTLEAFSSTLNTARREINYWYRDRTQELSLLLQSNAFRQPLEGFYLSRDEESLVTNRDELGTYFAIITDKFPLYADFIVLDYNGRVELASGAANPSVTERLREFQSKMLDSIEMASPTPGSEGDVMEQWFLVPVDIAGGHRLTVCVRVSLEGLDELVDENDAGIGTLYLVDQDGKLLTQPPYAPDGAGNIENNPKLGQKLLDVAAQAYDSEAPVMHKFTRDVVSDDGHHHGRLTYLSSRLYLPEFGWWLICEAEEGEVVAPMVTRKNRLLLANGVICLFFVIVAVLLSRNLLRPLTQLREAANRIDEGMVGVKIPPSRDNVIGETINAFNDMAERIAMTEAELQAKAKQLETQNEKLQALNGQLKKLSMTDSLTGLFNHRQFWNLLNSELSRVNLYQGDLALILLDIDNFREVNDEHGHETGDRMIAAVATVLKETVRETDIVARYEGVEFAVLLPDTSKEGALAVSEKIREAVHTMQFKAPESGAGVSLTVSIGVSVFRGSRREFFSSADRALGRSKEAGRNRISFELAEA